MQKYYNTRDRPLYVGLVNGADGSSLATYEYGPFGEPLRLSGVAKYSNPFRFSTKFCDDETGFFYYGVRFYNPPIGRWLSRDPSEEEGGNALYAFNGNDPVNHFDSLGNKYKLSFKQLELTPDFCGQFVYKIQWDVTKTKESDRWPHGWIYQKVVKTLDIWDCASSANHVQADPQTIYEGFTWYEAFPPTDTWYLENPQTSVYPNGKYTVRATAYFVLGTPGSDFQKTKGAGGADLGAPNTGSDFTPPPADSNTVKRTLTATWKCCSEKNLTKLKIR